MVQLGSWDNVSQTGWLTNNRDLPLTALEAEKSKGRCRFDVAVRS